MKLYLVGHYYDDLDENLYYHRIIGVYTSKKKAEEAVRYHRLLPSFQNYPNGFYIDLYELNQDHWEDGFITM